MDGKKLIGDIKNHLNNGGVVVISTYTKSTQYEKKHADMFKVGGDGSPLVQRGKNFDDIRYCAIRFYNYA